MSDSDEENAERQLKVVFVGDTSVGKTSIVKRYCRDEFARQHVSTSGVDFFLKRAVLPDRTQVALKIFDVGGHALVGNMLDKYVYNSDIIFVVYDITSLSSFEMLLDWINAIKNATSRNGAPLIALLGNKTDCEHQRAIRLDRTNEFARTHGLMQFTVSARTGESVNASLTMAVATRLGINLTRAQQEQQNVMVCAEIEPRYTLPAVDPETARSRAPKQPSSVCRIQ